MFVHYSTDVAFFPAFFEAGIGKKDAWVGLAGLAMG
jgi:hypothetical protein